MSFLSKNLSETKQFAKDFLVKLSGKTPKQGIVLALFGDLGSGKTTFTQFLAEELGVKENVNSPTFVLMKRYPLNPVRSRPAQQGGATVTSGRPASSGVKQLIHLDCYRLNKPEEVLPLGWEEMIADPGNLLVVEWPEKIEKYLPARAIKLYFEFIDENSRKIECK